MQAKIGLDSTACATGVMLYTVEITNPKGRSAIRGPIRIIDSTPKSSGYSGKELSDRTLILEKVKSLAVPGWNVTISVTKKVRNAYRIKVDVV